MVNPEKGRLQSVETRGYKGIQKHDISTAGFLFNPQELFDIVNEINRERPPSEWVGIEAYPMTDRVIFGLIKKLVNKAGKELPIPSMLGATEIGELVEKYPRSKISRVHLPFSSSLGEAVDKVRFESDRDRQLRSVGWILFFGPDRIREGFKIAKQQGADINAHIDVAEGILDNGLLQSYDFPSQRMVVEDEDKPLARVGDSIAKASRIAREANFRGMVAGVEHYIDEGNNPRELLCHPDVIDQVAVLHIASGGHGVLRVGDLENFHVATSDTRFKNPVTQVLDYNPFEMKKYTTREKHNLLKDTIEWIESIQAQNRN